MGKKLSASKADAYDMLHTVLLRGCFSVRDQQTILAAALYRWTERRGGQTLLYFKTAVPIVSPRAAVT